MQRAGVTYLNHLFGGFLSRFLSEHADDLTSYARKFGEEGAKSTSADFVWSLEIAGKMYDKLGPAAGGP